MFIVHHTLYTLSQSKLLENHTLQSGTYPWHTPPPPLEETRASPKSLILHPSLCPCLQECINYVLLNPCSLVWSNRNFVNSTAPRVSML